ncbi:MAG: Tim44/TimA family putative adaptor protein, partial [Parvularculaceae bacterium]|nr:Tim44/TimA family putative adaptor protein [Parvularculaceae bacterium]
LAPARARTPVIEDQVAEPAAKPEPLRPLPPVSPEAQALRDADERFDEKEFLNGAKIAYEMIIEAFSAGDLRNVRRYLGQTVFSAFRAAAAEREQRGQTSDVKFVGVEKATIVRSEARDGELLAVIEFVSDQVRVTRDKGGAVIAGDPQRIDRVVDRWTFSRKTDSDDPNWTLVATGGAS